MINMLVRGKTHGESEVQFGVNFRFGDESSEFGRSHRELILHLSSSSLFQDRCLCAMGTGRSSNCQDLVPSDLALQLDSLLSELAPCV